VRLLSLKLFLLFAPSVCSIAWIALKFWQDRPPSSEPVDPDVDVEAELKSTRNRGWTFFNLVLLNRSRMRISVVDVTFSIIDLVARHQAFPSTKESTFKVRRFVKPGDLLCVDLVELFYNAAGRPQGAYSFVVATTIRYRARGDLFTQPLPLCRVRMAALSPNALQRIRWYSKPIAPPEASRRLPELEPADLKWLEAETGQVSSLSFSAG
jgi:hypothetical protein